MWIFTRYGFFSIACARQPDGTVDPGTVMVRARRRAHLEKLAERFAALRESEILTLPSRDYRYRLIVPKADWLPVLNEMAAEQDWSNFKNEAERFQGDEGAAYIDALHRVWSLMHSYQGTERPQRERRC